MKRLGLARMMEERGPCRIWTDRNTQGEDREDDQTVPLSIRPRCKRSVNRVGKSFSNEDFARLRDSDWKAKLGYSLQEHVSDVHAPDFLLARQMFVHRRCC